MFSSEIAHFIHISLLRLYTLSMFPSQIVHFIHVSLSDTDTDD